MAADTGWQRGLRVIEGPQQSPTDTGVTGAAQISRRHVCGGLTACEAGAVTHLAVADHVTVIHLQYRAPSHGVVTFFTIVGGRHVRRGLAQPGFGGILVTIHTGADDLLMINGGDGQP